MSLDGMIFILNDLNYKQLHDGGDTHNPLMKKCGYDLTLFHFFFLLFARDSNPTHATLSLVERD